MQWLLDNFSFLGKPELTSTSDADESGDDDRAQHDRATVRSSTLKPQPHVTHMILENDDYFRECYYKGHHKSIAQCYDRFVQHSPLKRFAKHQQRFSAVPHLYGLEYLMTADDQRQQEPGEFPRIFLPQHAAQRVAGTIDTFVVSRQLDYMYHYIIEFAYMGSRRDWRIPAAMHQQRQLYRARRMKLHVPCPIHRNGVKTACPHECVVYTNKTSAFYQTCVALLQRQDHPLRYDNGVLQLATIPVSYNLVSFLCGPFQEGSDIGGGHDDDDEAVQMVRDYDQWVIVPVHFIDLWYASRVNGGDATTTSSRTNTNDATAAGENAEGAPPL